MSEEKDQQVEESIDEVMSSEDREMIGRLLEWAHEATDENIQNIQNVINNEQLSKEIRRMAEIALQEADYLKYLPENEMEEREYALCELIERREDLLDDLLLKLEKAEHDVEQTALADSIHHLLMKKSMDQKQRDAWEMYTSETAALMEKYDVQKLEDEIEYYEAWIEEAKRSITTPRYKNIPPCHFSDLNWDDSEDEDEEDDEEIACPKCGSKDMEEI